MVTTCTLVCKKNIISPHFFFFRWCTVICVVNNIAVVTTQFKQKDIHKYIWTSPDGRTRNQIDHIAVNGKFRSSILNARAYRGADIGSDHNLLICDMKLKLSKVVKKANRTKKFDTLRLQAREVRDSFF